MAILYDISRCTGCRACMVACKQWKNLPADIVVFEGDYQSPKHLSAHTLTVVKMSERMEDGKLHWDFIKTQCMHCLKPGCIAACPKDALILTRIGAVIMDNEKCIGCGLCIKGCPFAIPKIAMPERIMVKCDMCQDRIEHSMKPACVQSCTASAISFGTRREMVALANKRLKQVRKTFPHAQIYGADTTSGESNMIYVLTEKPAIFGLPDVF